MGIAAASRPAKEPERRFCEDCFRCKAEIPAIRSNQSRQVYAAAFRTSQGQAGVRGESSVFDSPRRLYAAFDARKRLPEKQYVNILPVCARGSLTLRRAKAATEKYGKKIPPDHSGGCGIIIPLLCPPPYRPPHQCGAGLPHWSPAGRSRSRRPGCRGPRSS